MHHACVVADTELYVGRHVQELNCLPEPLEFYRSYVSMNVPVVVRNAVKHWPAVRLWTTDYLRFFHIIFSTYCYILHYGTFIVLPEGKASYIVTVVLVV